MIRMKKTAFAMIVAALSSACPMQGDDLGGEGEGEMMMGEGEGEMMMSRFTSEFIGPDNMEVIHDSTSGLTWINDIRACFAGVTMPGDQCDTLVFAGREDWRIPNTNELSALHSSIAAEERHLNYINSTCGVMTATDGWVLTENTAMPGALVAGPPGNAGIRCVASTM